MRTISSRICQYLLNKLTSTIVIMLVFRIWGPKSGPLADSSGPGSAHLEPKMHTGAWTYEMISFWFILAQRIMRQAPLYMPFGVGEKDRHDLAIFRDY